MGKAFLMEFAKITKKHEKPICCRSFVLLRNVKLTTSNGSTAFAYGALHGGPRSSGQNPARRPALPYVHHFVWPGTEHKTTKDRFLNS